MTYKNNIKAQTPLKIKLLEAGYQSITDFTTRNHIHHAYISALYCPEETKVRIVSILNKTLKTPTTVNEVFGGIK